MPRPGGRRRGKLRRTSRRRKPSRTTAAAERWSRAPYRGALVGRATHLSQRHDHERNHLRRRGSRRQGGRARRSGAPRPGHGIRRSDVGFTALGAYLGRDLSGGAGPCSSSAFACIIGLNVAAARAGALAISCSGWASCWGSPSPRHRRLRSRRPVALWQAAGATAAFVARSGHTAMPRARFSSWGRTLFWALLAPWSWSGSSRSSSRSPTATSSTPSPDSRSSADSRSSTSTGSAEQVTTAPSWSPPASSSTSSTSSCSSSTCSAATAMTGDLVKVAYASDEAEAELLQGLPAFGRGVGRPSRSGLRRPGFRCRRAPSRARRRVRRPRSAGHSARDRHG